MHDDVIKWKHFPCYWPFVRGIHRSLVNSPHKGQWRGALMFSLIWAWTSGWVSNCEAGDWRHRGAHYDIIIMDKVVMITICVYHCHARSKTLGLTNLLVGGFLVNTWCIQKMFACPTCKIFDSSKQIILFRSQIFLNPLAQMAVFLAPGCQTLGYVKSC